MPDDPTPHGGEALHQPPDRATIPDPKPGQASDEPVRGLPRADRAEPNIGERPSLPDEPELMAADSEDEEADPVVDSGPGISDDDTRKPSVTRQPA
ncbi:MAG: hypothetical protein JWP65_3371 [Ramlibacter sp.]|jgi:hypothetical protein|uniref:hypothetical protein n=1 Tax=Ramlibacter sp. TaxID=1917967 RepID=UPI00260A392E|nr:hypothetical protein [Ramlibacter sp.]MDB5752950.1 hypothetical protein [Ramlibacter sp.]